MIPASLRSGKIHWLQLYTKLGDQIGFTLGFSMKNEPLAQLRTSSQRNCAKLQAEVEASSQQSYAKLQAKIRVGLLRGCVELRAKL